MKKAAAAIACMVLLSSAASASEVRFRGAFTLTSVSHCLARYVGETFNSAFRPAGIGDNPNITSLTELNAYSGDVYELPGTGFQINKWHNVQGYGFDNLHYTFNARIKITGQSPVRIGTNTSFVTLTGLIHNMGNDPGSGGTCVAGFRASYFRRIEY
jgi:hypothetical protein